MPSPNSLIAYNINEFKTFDLNISLAEAITICLIASCRMKLVEKKLRYPVNITYDYLFVSKYLCVFIPPAQVNETIFVNHNLSRDKWKKLRNDREIQLIADRIFDWASGSLNEWINGLPGNPGYEKIQFVNGMLTYKNIVYPCSTIRHGWAGLKRLRIPYYEVESLRRKLILGYQGK